MHLNLDHFIFALSDTVDLVGVDEVLHSKRVGYMAHQCCSAMDSDEEKRRRFLHLGLLHDCGVSSTEERTHLVSELEWNDADIHCLKGAERMSFFPPLNGFAPAILHHHTRWENLAGLDLDSKVKTEANLLYLLDRVDYLGQTFPGKNWISKKDHIRRKILDFRGTYFRDDLTEAFLDVSAAEAFWFGLEPIMVKEFHHLEKTRSPDITVSAEELNTVAQLFAQIVDAKSPYTAEHSFGVARLAKHLAELTGLDENKQAQIEVAGLLHDLGKLQVPDRVLGHPGPLGERELESMRHHSFATYRILNTISGLEKIAEWAGNHHEALDGSGYPFRKTADDLGVESRIVTIADIFQALAQNRPYRGAESRENILAVLQRNSERGRLDGDLVDTVIANSHSCFAAATNQEPGFSS